MATGGSTLHGVTDDQKRWLVFGIALNKVLVSQIRSLAEREVQREYDNLQTSHNIHTQSSAGRLKHWPSLLRYENINGNSAFPRLPGGRHNYSLFDCQVTSHVDFAKLYLENHMAKFNAFDEHCDASAVVSLLGRVPVFSPAVQSAAGDVRQARNAWAHCVFGDWNPVNYQQRFNEMEQLVKTLGLPPANERNLLEELKEWESKGTILCMNATVDPDLLKLVQQHVNTLKTDVEVLAFEVQEDKEQVSEALQIISTRLEELEARVATMEHEQEVMKEEQSLLSKTVDALQSSVYKRVVSVKREQEVMKRKQSDVDTRVANVELEQEVMKQEQSSLSKTVDSLQSSVDTRVANVEHQQEVIKQEQSSLSKTVDALQSSVDTRVANVEHEQEVMKEEQSSLSDKMKDVQQRVAGVEDKLSSSTLQENRGDSSCSYGGSGNIVPQQDLSGVSVEIASCESDIAFFAERHDSDTRQWFFDDFNEWFHNPGDSRAYVLLGDPGVGKSVLAGVMTQRMTKAGHLGAAYFCHHNDGTRNDPRYLLGTVACQLCNCNTQYKDIIRGERGVKMLLDSSKLGVRELFTKLLQEPLSKCSPCNQRKLVIIDALDETEYESREDFLDLIMHRFPLLPKWLVFFITSRPEDSVRFRLKKYNPCVKICAGNSDQDNFYQQHQQDIQTFFKKRIDFSGLSVTIENISKTCNGLFLYAHYIVEELKISADSGEELNHLSDFFPGDIDSFFLQNFKRVYDQVGQDIFNKLFGCAIVSPAPLPVSIIPYMLTREKSNCDEQQVIDAISQFVVFRVSDQTLMFLHNLIPAWLTDKNKASRKLFVDKKIAGEYLRTVFVEILPFVVNEPQTGPCIDDELKDYVLRVGIRFLCEMGDKNSLKVAYDSLTNYHFLERRMKYGRIDIYRLLKDFRILARHPSLEVTKREILQEIVFSIESNVLVLLECPHLLNSCLRNASNAVQDTISIPQVSAPGLHISVCRLPDDKLADIRCFTTSACKGIVAGAKNRSVFFFDACLFEKLSGPFDLSGAIDNINHLEFTPDGKYLFFGRLDKWFSVERGCVQDFPHFSGNSHVYQWGVLAHDKTESIVVKRSFLSNPRTCEGDCLSYLLVLWALEEIKQSRDDSDVMCHKQAERIGRLWNRLVRTIYQTRDVPDHDDRFCYCCSRLIELLQSNQEPSLETVRQLIIELYHFMFKYQVWDLATGTPVLQQAFSKGIQLSPFTYFCHVFCAFSDLGLGTCCSGTEKGRSICNIAVWCALGQLKSFDFEYLSRWGSFSEKLLRLYVSSESGMKRGVKKRSPWELTSEKQFSFKLLEVLCNLLWLVERKYLEQKSKVEEEERKSELERTISCEEFLNKKKKKKKERLPLELMLQKELSFELLEDLHNLLWLVERKYLEQKSKVEEEERKSELERTTSCKDVEEFLKKMEERLPWELTLEKELSFELLEDLHNLLWLVERKYLEQKSKVEEEERKSELERTTSCKDVEEFLKKMEERLPWELTLEKELSFELLEDLHNLLWLVERKCSKQKSKVEEEERKSELERTTSCKDVEEFLKKMEERFPWELTLEKELSFELLEDLHNLLWLVERNCSEQKSKMEEEERKSELERTISCEEFLKKMERRLTWERKLDKELSFELLGDVYKLLRLVERKYSEEKGKVEEEERESELERTTSCKDVEEFLLLQATNLKQAKFIAERKMINKFTYSTITKDCLSFLYSHEGSLHAKSLETGAVFTSVSGLNLHYFGKEKRVGYLFRCAAEEKAIFLTNLSSPFKFLVMSPSVVKTIALMFLSIDSVMSVSSDSRLMLWQTTTFADKEIFTCVSKFSLTESSLHVKNCVLSTDGSLIAIHQETKVELYSFAKSELKFLHSVRFESTCEFAVTHFAFSADSTALLFYTQDSLNYSHFHAWDIKEKVFSASFKFPGLKTADCCYLSSDKLVLCFNYEIEIWEYTGHTCGLLTRLAVEKPYNSVLFNQCTMSEDKQFLACCVVDVILVYCLNISNIHSSKQVLRGHLGRIEFCRFLKINRYLISYGIDGMIFLWDIGESKAVAYTRIAEGKENIVSMAVSPEEDRIVCFMTSGRVHMIKLSRLGAALPAETSLQLQGDVALDSQIRILSTEDDLSEAMNSSDSEEDADTSDCGYLYESD